MKASRNRRVAWTIIGALFLALVALTYYDYRRDMDVARARVSSGSQVVNTPCGLIEYADLGKGPPPVQVSYQELAESVGLSKSSAQAAVSWLVRRKLLAASKENATAIPCYTVRSPWRDAARRVSLRRSQ